ncbi:MAG: NAD-dependent protein deacetylase [Polyangiaceae bacterium]
MGHDRSHTNAVDAPLASEVDTLAGFLRGGSVVVLTGAGVSTESGIPDYRSPEALAKTRRPIHGAEFIRSAALRQRYWARAMTGWERFRSAAPNPSHRALATLEHAGIVRALVTQNVDRLHRRAGSTNVTELHGALEDVICLTCHAPETRASLQARMRADNPNWIDGPTPMAPDGDADLANELVERFVSPSCLACGGAMKPDVVFFGENVARPVVDRAFAEVDSARALLVVGTSLAVFSGYRFLRRAAERQIPIAIVNRGPVRGEEHAAFKIQASTGRTLEAVTGQVT